MTDTPGPHEHPSTQAVRDSALALLASGNSLESVAHVLGVPVDRLQSWATLDVSASPAPGEPKWPCTGVSCVFTDPASSARLNAFAIVRWKYSRRVRGRWL